MQPTYVALILFRRESIMTTEVEVRVGKVKNGKDEVTADMVNGGGLDLEVVQYDL